MVMIFEMTNWDNENVNKVSSEQLWAVLRMRIARLLDENKIDLSDILDEYVATQINDMYYTLSTGYETEVGFETMLVTIKELGEE